MAQTKSIVRDWSRPQSGPGSYPVAANTTIYESSIVMVNAAGYAVPAADTANSHVVGMCKREVANGATAGAVQVIVEAPVRVKLKTALTLTQAMVGDVVYVVDDEEFTNLATASNDIRVGFLVNFISDTEGEVEIWPAANILSSV